MHVKRNLFIHPIQEMYDVSLFLPLYQKVDGINLLNKSDLKNTSRHDISSTSVIILPFRTAYADPTAISA